MRLQRGLDPGGQAGQRGRGGVREARGSELALRRGRGVQGRDPRQQLQLPPRHLHLQVRSTD